MVSCHLYDLADRSKDFRISFSGSHSDDLNGLLQRLVVHADPDTTVIKGFRQGVGPDPVVGVHGKNGHKRILCLYGRKPRDVQYPFVKGTEDGIETF